MKNTSNRDHIMPIGRCTNWAYNRCLARRDGMGALITDGGQSLRTRSTLHEDDVRGVCMATFSCSHSLTVTNRWTSAGGATPNNLNREAISPNYTHVMAPMDKKTNQQTEWKNILACINSCFVG